MIPGGWIHGNDDRRLQRLRDVIGADDARIRRLEDIARQREDINRQREERIRERDAMDMEERELMEAIRRSRVDSGEILTDNLDGAYGESPHYMGEGFEAIDELTSNTTTRSLSRLQMPRFDSTATVRERESFVANIEKTIKTRLGLIDTIKTLGREYDGECDRIKLAYFTKANVDSGEDNTITKQAAKDTLVQALLDAGRILCNLDNKCDTYEKAHNDGAKSAYALASNPHWCNYRVIQGFHAPQADCISVLEYLKIQGYDHKTRHQLDFGCRLVIEIQSLIKASRELVYMAEHQPSLFDGGNDEPVEPAEEERAAVDSWIEDTGVPWRNDWF